MTTTTNNAAPSGAQSGQAQTQLVTQNNTALKQVQESTITKTLERVNAMQQSGELVLPHGYEAANALKSAWLYLQTVENRGHQKAIDVCTKDSICNCLLEMCIRGEHPKKHCYFIPCGNSLEFWERYTGKVMRAKRDTNIADVHAQVVYEGDDFSFISVDGCYQLIEHKTCLENMDTTKIKAAYAVVILKDGTKYIEVMTMDMIRKAWQQGSMKGNSGAHMNFTDQMAKKTVIARACKIALDGTEDNFNTEEDGDLAMTPPDATEAELEAANKEVKQIGHRQPSQTATVHRDSFEENADYEEVGEEPENLHLEPEQAASAKSSGRKCPI